jgi:phage shock protein PspC (stress-responsive transcriptional regulator)
MEKKLRRSSNQILGGVCAGIGDYFGWDYTLVRAGYALLSLFTAGFPGITIYIVLWIIMPKEY